VPLFLGTTYSGKDRINAPAFMRDAQLISVSLSSGWNQGGIASTCQNVYGPVSEVYPLQAGTDGPGANNLMVDLIATFRLCYSVADVDVSDHSGVSRRLLIMGISPSSVDSTLFRTFGVDPDAVGYLRVRANSPAGRAICRSTSSVLPISGQRRPSHGSGERSTSFESSRAAR
jgi:hypothetical protein